MDRLLVVFHHVQRQTNGSSQPPTYWRYLEYPEISNPDTLRETYKRYTDPTTPASNDLYTLKDGAMRYSDGKGETRICLPEGMVREVLELAHDGMWHFGAEKTYDRVARTYYRPGLSTALSASGTRSAGN